MANTFSQLYAHIIFAPYKRENLITKGISTEIYRYICGIISNKGQKSIRINGMPDHIHILFGFSPDISLSNLVRDIKCNSTLYIKREQLIRGFQWQAGFGAFSYHKSLLPQVSKYIENQESHHKKRTFREEYIKLLNKAAIEYNPEYLFEWYD